MKFRMLGQTMLTAALAIGAASANTPTDADLAKQVRHEVLMYPRYTLYDDVSFRVNNGNVELLGEVTQPYKKQDLGKIVQSIRGVASVTNELKVLPLSPFDDQLRMRVTRAIFRDPSLLRYGMGPNSSIHIIVENGHVTLAGSVDTQADKQLAGMRAATAGLSFGSIVNNLSVDQPAKSKKS